MYLNQFFKIFFIFILFFLTIKPIEAIVDPLETANNKFGIHISTEADIDLAKELVNSNGGNWGYVTFVIREDERDLNKWQTFFDKLRQAKLIPIVRLATRYENNHWIKPREADINPWVEFLDNLNWVTQNRYVVLFNEPNHAGEWGGEINPAEYANIYKKFHAALKASSEDFFVLPAGLDTAPENSETTMHPQDFFEKMYQADPQIFTLYDGLTSHAYPHPDFSGGISTSGRWSVRSFLWETEILSGKGYDRDKPIFITETGWARSKVSGKHQGISDIQIANNLETSFKQIWSDSRVVAITPFILNYNQDPFAQFSWIDPVNQQQTIIYNRIKNIEKTSGEPIRLNTASILKPFYPSTLQPESSYLIALKFLNTGQVIWNKENTRLRVTTNSGEIQAYAEEVPETMPNKEAKVWIHIDTPKEPGTFTLTTELNSDNKSISSKEVFEVLVSPPNYLDKVKVWIQSVLYKDFDQV